MHYQPDRRPRDARGSSASRRSCAGSTPSAAGSRPSSFIALAEQSDLIVELGAFALREATAAAASWEPARRRQPRRSSPSTSRRTSSSTRTWCPTIEAALAVERALAGPARPRDHRERRPARHRRDARARCSTSSGSASGSRSTTSGRGTRRSRTSRCCTRGSSRSTSPSSDPRDESEQNDLLLETIVSLGGKLDMTMLAEGIETRAQLDRLRRVRVRARSGLPLLPRGPRRRRPRALASRGVRRRAAPRLRHERTSPRRRRVSCGRSLLDVPRRAAVGDELEERARRERLGTEDARRPPTRPIASSSSASTGLSAACHTTAWEPYSDMDHSLSTTWYRYTSRGAPSRRRPVHPASPRRSRRA